MQDRSFKKERVGSIDESPKTADMYLSWLQNAKLAFPAEEKVLPRAPGNDLKRMNASQIEGSPTDGNWEKGDEGRTEEDLCH
ncbi:hypothetical protein J6590_030038 [Homalodisca vitripennis]|nr:hypothetical protein J6590_030038 [Homalodisca vitripennis]